MIEKALGYVLRVRDGGHELLVFEHTGIPEAGVQVPGGTLAAGEAPHDAVVREVFEESGLELDGWEALGAVDGPAERWHVFAAVPAVPIPETWTVRPRGSATEEALRFEYAWRPLAGDLELAGRCAEGLRLVRDWLGRRA